MCFSVTEMLKNITQETFSDLRSTVNTQKLHSSGRYLSITLFHVFMIWFEKALRLFSRVERTVDKAPSGLNNQEENE